MVSEVKRRRWSEDSVEENSKNCLDKHMGTRRPELRRINNLESLTHQLYRENSGRRKVRRKPSKKKNHQGKKKNYRDKSQELPRQEEDYTPTTGKKTSVIRAQNPEIPQLWKSRDTEGALSGHGGKGHVQRKASETFMAYRKLENNRFMPANGRGRGCSAC